jgi:hypothetical protein
VLFRYPNNLTDVSWVMGGPGVGELVLKCLCTPWISMSVEYMAPYQPSEEEKADTHLFARNVRQHMVRAKKEGSEASAKKSESCRTRAERPGGAGERANVLLPFCTLSGAAGMSGRAREQPPSLLLASLMLLFRTTSFSSARFAPNPAHLRCSHRRTHSRFLSPTRASTTSS